MELPLLRKSFVISESNESDVQKSLNDLLEVLNQLVNCAKMCSEPVLARRKDFLDFKKYNKFGLHDLLKHLCNIRSERNRPIITVDIREKSLRIRPDLLNHLTLSL
ncbi:uncharacterized protein LOC131886808 [Tigriopus californicus]|uniref:uncharacterized protein LOC131886808 n=1 Tax=Tigriopus californicus TaxID=6832 RepID=UPI0027DA4242|nr:uncharacterized protein LOC131886808 [Tigriopus californicus]